MSSAENIVIPGEWLEELRTRYRRPSSRFVQMAGVDVHLLDEGSPDAALTVVLLSAQWLGVSQGDRLAPLLAASHRVISIDLPGQGLSGPFPDGDYSAAGYARLITAVLSELGVGRHVLIGTSFSGIAAAVYATGPLPGLSGLVLATSSGLPRDPGGPSPGAAPTDPALAAVEGRLPRAFYAWKLGTLLRRPVAETLIDEVHAMNELPGRAAEAARRVVLYDSAELTEALPKVAVPVLVLWSSDSTYLPASMADRIAALAPEVASVHVYPNTGHLLIADAPEEVARDLGRFLQTLSPRFAALADDDLDTDQQRMAAVAMRSGPYQAFLRAPVLWEQLQPLRKYLAGQSVLSPIAREAAVLALARHWQSTAAFAGHYGLAERAGLTPSEIDAIGRGEPITLADPVAQVVLECTVAVLERHALGETLYTVALTLIGERGLVELLGLIGFFTTIALTLNVAEIAGDAPFGPAAAPYSPADESETGDSPHPASD